MAHPGGRPNYNRMALVNEFVEWAANNSNAFTVPQFWAALKRIPSETCANWAQEDPEFSQLYHLGLELIGINRLQATGGKDPELPTSIYLKGYRHYDMSKKAQYLDEVEEAAYREAKAKIKAAKEDLRSQGIDPSSPEGQKAMADAWKL